MEAKPNRLMRLTVLMRRRPWRTIGLTILVGFLLVNILAYCHARAMLKFSSSGDRTPPPQSLSAWQKLKVLTCGVTVPRPENTRSPQDLGLRSETIRFTATDGVNLEGWLLSPPNPKGTVLLFHGYAASRCILLGEGKAFYEMGFAVGLIDFRGSGGSDGSSTSLGFHEAQDVAAAVGYIRFRGFPSPLILYGQSMGGAAVLRSVAALEVKPDAVILESVFGRMLATVRNRFALMGAPSFPASELFVFWGGVQVGFSGFSHNPEEYALACACPTLVLHGTDDRNARPEDGQAIFDNLAGIKEIALIEGVGHESLYGKAPGKWKSAVERFLAKDLTIK